MWIGIVSDTHNNQDHARKAVEQLQSAAVEQIIHCGDITTPEIVALFDFCPVTFVYGNSDYVHQPLQHAVSQLPDAQIYQSHQMEIDGKRIGVCHGHQPDVMQRFLGLRYDYLLHGHTHIRRDVTQGATRIINPGALGGRHREARSIVLLNPMTDELRTILID